MVVWGERSPGSVVCGRVARKSAWAWPGRNAGQLAQAMQGTHPHAAPRSGGGWGGLAQARHGRIVGCAALQGTRGALPESM